LVGITPLIGKDGGMTGQTARRDDLRSGGVPAASPTPRTSQKGADRAMPALGFADQVDLRQ
jgi:hypothetical protein